MKRFIAFDLKDGSKTTIVVETNEPDISGGAKRTGQAAHEAIEKATQTFEAALDTVHSATESAVQKLRNMSEKPDEITMEFGFNLNAQFGAVIASTSAAANYKVTITWSKKPKE